MSAGKVTFFVTGQQDVSATVKPIEGGAVEPLTRRFNASRQLQANKSRPRLELGLLYKTKVP